MHSFDWLLVLPERQTVGSRDLMISTSSDVLLRDGKILIGETVIV